ncbi:MerR family transcriptional regulator [Paenibacillus sp. sptzw28]|uniref:MerR family transcriptional regulator n=1 Tax=Paenibacillus sp. sptzw28 TaxID=715179 RepID=UPI001C6EB000|nr:MerR family transcriptional regulator [Paenibacillus sp. sptzw28]QYR19244.1 MerR family transcriptional regulator [Paenibacillus sp. sptzw28]
MKISELSKITGVSVRSIRHYEKKNLISVSRLENGYREFNEAAINQIKQIKSYLKLGLTTEQIERTLNCTDSDSQEAIEQCQNMLRVYEAHLSEINQTMETLANVQQELQVQIETMKISLQKYGLEE